MTRRAAMLIVLGLLSSAQVMPAGAQAPPPAWLQDASGSAAKVETRHLVAGTEAIDLSSAAAGRVTLRLRLTPRPGMRVYAHDATGYVPLSLRLDPVTGLTIRRPAYPSAMSYVFPPTGERSRVYETAVTVEQVVVLSEALRRRLRGDDETTLSATLRYQACDDTLCYRPETVRIAWQVGR